MTVSIQQLTEVSNLGPDMVALVIDNSISPIATDGVIDAGSLDTLTTSVSTPFTSNDHDGKIVTIAGAGSGGTDHHAVATFVSSSELTLNPVAITAVAGVDVTFAEAKQVSITTLADGVQDLFTTVVIANPNNANTKLILDSTANYDPTVIFKTDGTTRLAFGIDDTDSDILVFSSAEDLSSASSFRIDPANFHIAVNQSPSSSYPIMGRKSTGTTYLASNSIAGQSSQIMHAVNDVEMWRSGYQASDGAYVVHDIVTGATLFSMSVNCKTLTGNTEGWTVTNGGMIATHSSSSPFWGLRDTSDANNYIEGHLVRGVSKYDLRGKAGSGDTETDIIRIDLASPEVSIDIDTNGVTFGGTNNDSTARVEGDFAVKRTDVSSDVNTANSVIYGVSDTSSARTITLDTDDVINGRLVEVKDESGGAMTNNITIDTEGSETIDGASSISISNDYGAVQLYSDGSNWFVRNIYTAGGI